ncbi:MAG: hypothetical protein PHS45_03115 [Bacilli bacterium]|nr:hypothetical protein [Bacilli bacterium]
MRKIFISITIVILILIGCNKDNYISFDRYLEEISVIIYNDIQLVPDDFEAIGNLLYEIKFTTKAPDNLGTPISKINLTTIEGAKYELNMHNNNIIEYKNGDKKYYATNNNSDLDNLYNKLKYKYTDLSFFDIIPSNNDLNINNPISLLEDRDEKDLNEEIRIFKFITNDPISELKVIDDNKIIYEKDELKPNDYIYLEFLFNDNFKITFKNRFNRLIEVIPNYNNETITFDKRMKPTL